MIERKCRQCGIPFQVPYPSSKRTNCTPTCRGVKSKTRADKGTRKTQWVTVTCPCGKDFQVPPNQANSAARGGFRLMCSHQCYLALRRPGTGRPVKGNRWLNRDGYVEIYIPLDERPLGLEHRIRQHEHRIVMQKVLGRELLPGENVHHINGVRSDNRPENLELWVEKQPKGQRASDLLAWAREIIARYEPIEELI